MKLRVKVEGKSYEVEIESVEPIGIASAASRVEGSPAGAAPPRPPSNGAPLPGRITLAAQPAPATHAPPTPPPPRAPWHELTVGPEGRVLAPIEGVVTILLVKVGDAVKANDPILNIEVSHVLSPQKQPLIGTIRAIEPGVVAEIAVQQGQSVRFGETLVRVQPASKPSNG